MEPVLGIGWDVGGWMGRKNAFAAALWDPESGVSWLGDPKTVSIPVKGYLTFDTVLHSCVPSLPGRGLDPSPIIVAIDAPLGYPRLFARFVAGDADVLARPEREIDNPLAYRETDRHIHQVFGKKPLSATFDKLGNNATVAISHVLRWRAEHGFSIPPIYQRGEGDRTIIEVYPALVKANATSEAIPAIHKLIPASAEPGTDPYDATICAILALAYAAGGRIPGIPRLVEPPDSDPAFQTEGWIYYPAQKSLASATHDEL